MVSRSVIFWNVDTQADFMLPGGKLYVPGAEKLIPNLTRLTNASRQGCVLIVGDMCVHAPDDPEFQQFPPHCVIGTPGAEMIPETRADRALLIPNRPGAPVPEDLSGYQQVILEKQTLDVFDNPNTQVVLERIARFTERDAEVYVYGVVTEYCVRLAARGLLQRARKVALVHDAIKTLKEDNGAKAIGELTALGARLVNTNQALSALAASQSRGA
ncbi:MAG TPA: isochorismatase family protein [Verrucomicrobiae bacterium]|jgi:nicotinamidase/pyrazinamidase|nr:isochorismatase family protein [Verrucomicrobiae bacterium]